MYEYYLKVSWKFVMLYKLLNCQTFSVSEYCVASDYLVTLNTVTGGQLWPFQDVHSQSEKPNVTQAGIWFLKYPSAVAVPFLNVTAQGTWDRFHSNSASKHTQFPSSSGVYSGPLFWRLGRPASPPSPSFSFWGSWTQNCFPCGCNKELQAALWSLASDSHFFRLRP